ncbi:MAG: GGDEF domain-containing protein [Polyangiaceae bacterium]
MSDEGASPTERALAAILELLDHGTLLFQGDDLVCTRITSHTAALMGLPKDAIVGRRRSELLGAIVTGDDASARAVAALANVGPAEKRREAVTLQSTPPRFVDWATAPAGDGRVDLLVDRTTERALRADLAQLQAKMAETALVDEVTGLSNRRHFEAEMDREHRRSQRAWASYAIARVDVDGMDRLVEELGRAQADTLLRRVGEELRAGRREYDLVARWDDDELIVLLPGIDAQAVGSVLARSLGQMRDAARTVAGRDVTFCSGVALWIPPSIENAGDVVTRAGTALQAAKLMGPGTMEVDATLVEWRDDAGT